MPWFTGWTSPWQAVLCVKCLLDRSNDLSGTPQPANDTHYYITWAIPGHFYLVRAVPGAVPTVAASMDGSDGRPDGSPGVGKGLTYIQ